MNSLRALTKNPLHFDALLMIKTSSQSSLIEWWGLKILSLNHVFHDAKEVSQDHAHPIVMLWMTSDMVKFGWVGQHYQMCHQKKRFTVVISKTPWSPSSLEVVPE
jgi:hypothetical protein